MRVWAIYQCKKLINCQYSIFESFPLNHSLDHAIWWNMKCVCTWYLMDHDKNASMISLHFYYIASSSIVVIYMYNVKQNIQWNYKAEILLRNLLSFKEKYFILDWISHVNNYHAINIITEYITTIICVFIDYHHYVQGTKGFDCLRDPFCTRSLSEKVHFDHCFKTNTKHGTNSCYMSPFHTSC